MSTVSGGLTDVEADRRVKAVQGEDGKIGADLFTWRIIWLPFVVMFIFYSGVRVYEQIYGFSMGLDSFSDEFKLYWMTILWVELPVLGAAFIGVMAYLWKTRDRNLAAITPREEMRRYFVLMAWLTAYATAVYWGASFFTEQDGTWHQTVVRDTDFTPSHILEFYLSYPIYIIMGCGAFMYAKTRLPYYAKGYSVPFLLFVVGPFMIFPNVGLNEWGHTFWFMEEIFVAPLHWGFVFFGWFALAVFGVSLQILGRLREVIIANGLEQKCAFQEESSPFIAGQVPVTT